MNVKLAIVIPYFKNDFFEETLLSLQQQTDKRFTVYIGDDASENHINNLINEFKKDITIKYHRFAENLGSKSLTKQWDRCIKLIGNETWVCILGDDDCLSEKFVECFYESISLLETEESNVLRFSSYRINGEGDIISNLQNNEILQSSVESFAHKFYGTKNSSLSEHIFSINVYKKYGFRDYPLAWCSDDMAWLEFSEGKNIVSCNEAYVKIRVYSRSISGSFDNRKKIAKKSFFKDLVLEKQSLFSRIIAIKNLKKFEVFLVMTKDLRKYHFLFFLKRFLYLKTPLECFKFILRYSVNIFK